MALAVGQVLNYAYTGAAQSVTLVPGRYRFEVWGAQGGYRSSSSYGGLGGYSLGELTVQDAAIAAFVLVGGSGNTGGTGGGFNGGGQRGSHNGGGGATDIRLLINDLLHRVIVAGGGGSDGASDKAGGYGGGESGQSRTDNYGTGGYGGTQTGVSSSSWQTTTQPTSTTTQEGAYAGFGFGGNGITRSSGYGGAGGGGWYGGSGSYPDSSGDDDRGGAGGSGFVWTGANAPSGYGLTAAHQLANASTKAGNVSFPATGGSTETGHAGDGYARITVLELFPLVPDPPGNLRQTAKDYFSLSIAWDAAKDATGYEVWRDGVKLASLTGLTYTDETVEPKGSYVYTVYAVNDEGKSDPVTLAAETIDAFAERRLVITRAEVSPQTVTTGAQYTVTVAVEEQIVILPPEVWYSGELTSNEV